VAARRGHDVVVYEAASKPGGQVLLIATSQRRRELIGIVDWRVAQCRADGVAFQFDRLVEAAEVIAEQPDVVIVATGGLAQTDVLTSGNDLVVSAWDILSGEARPGRRVLLYDDAGDHTALMAAERLVEAGSEVEIMTPDRMFAPEVMGMNLVPYVRSLQRPCVRFTVTYRVHSARRAGNHLIAAVGSDYGKALEERTVDQIIVNHGTVPVDDLYFALKPHSSNLGEIDYAALLSGRAQSVHTNPSGRFQLFRVGDAISSRNIHAAIYDALRLVKDL